jgi:hypothetical protein
MNFDPFNGLDFRIDDCSPEKRLWVMVLETFVDDMIIQNKYLKVANYKIKMANSYHFIRLSKVIRESQKKKDRLMELAKASHIKELCDLIDMSHDWFVRGLTKVANDPDFISRPVRVMEIKLD